MKNPHYHFWKQELHEKKRLLLCNLCLIKRATGVYHTDKNKDNDEEDNLKLLCDDCREYLFGKKTNENKPINERITRVLCLIEQIKKRRYYEKHRTLKNRIDEIEELLQ